MAQARKKKGSSADRPGQADPTAPLDGGELLAAARPVLELLREDLGKRAEDVRVERALRARYEDEKAARRTSDNFGEWRDSLLAQVAASWFLSCVFVRTLEDRGLLGQARLAGPGATDSQRLFVELAPSLTERDYLLFVFRELAELPAARALFDREHAMVWQLSPSADAAKQLLRLFRTPSTEAPAFRFGQAKTHFLGDLYQELYEDVRKRYALLQTPDFIESFILDRTLEPAIDRFGLDDTTLIDPTCGSGHFLLGAFDRLFDHRLRAKPGGDVRQAAHQALDAVYGADINSYAVAIARFRLTLSYLDKAVFKRLADAPELPLRLVVVDSLLHNLQAPQTELSRLPGQRTVTWEGIIFALEDDAGAQMVFGRRHAVVVGNPPFSAPFDEARKELYRARYRSATGRFTLAVPFVEFFFQCVRERGYVGFINSLTFATKRFGKTLLETVFPRYRLLEIVNTSGVVFEPPGFGMPTVMVIGTNEAPARRTRVVLQVGNDDGQYADAAEGLAWKSIAAAPETPGYEDDYIQVSEWASSKLWTYPWSLQAGEGAHCAALLEASSENILKDYVAQGGVGFMGISGADDAFVCSRAVARRQNFERVRSYLKGEQVRDYQKFAESVILWPYDDKLNLCPLDDSAMRWLWPLRTYLAGRATREKVTYDEAGRCWYEFHQIARSRINAPCCILYPEIAPQHTFVLVRRESDIWAERSLMCFVPAAVDERETLALLAYLNSSVVCAWIRKRVPPTSDATPRRGKGMGRTSVAYRLAGGLAEGIPVPQALFAGDNASILASLFSAMDAIATALERTRETAREKLAAFDEPRTVLAQLENEIAALIGRGVVVQEEIDWTIYSILFGTKTVMQSLDELLMSIALPHTRPFCTLDTVSSFGDSVGLAPTVADEWQNRRALIRADEILQDVERNTFKRQWGGRRGEWGRLATESQRIATDVLIARIDEVFSCSVDASLPLESQEILNRLYAVDGTIELLAAFSAREDVHPEMALDWILQANSVPFLDALIFAESGLAKQRMWRSVWSQDREGGIAQELPSVFESADFLESRYWSLRGRRNLCQESLILYPACQSDENGQLAYGWAGWNHLQQAKALASLYQTRKREEGWTAKRLVPMLAGLLELLPWVKQWHNEPSPEFDDQRMGDFFADFLDAECQSLGLTYANLQAWRPNPATKKSKTVGTQATSDDSDDSDSPPAKRTRKKGKV